LGIVAAVAAGTGSAAETFLEPDIDSKYRKTCISSDCHPVAMSGTIIKHPPYLEGHCQACHEDHGFQTAGLLKDNLNQACLSCHTSVETDTVGGGKLIHPPGGKGCVECHNPHESRVRNLLRADDQLKSCATCHADFLKKARERPYRHKFFEPVTECGSCHYAHRKGEGKYLQQNLEESCLTCHDLPIRVDGRSLENVAEAIRVSKVVHPAMEKAGCQNCHTPHGADQPSLLRQGYPAGMYDTYKTENFQVCWQCHDAKLAESADGMEVTQFRDGPTNLHRVHVVEMRRGRACHICHTAHASDTPHLLRETIRFKEWNAPMGLKLTQDGGSCATPCHAERSYSRAASKEAQ